jgi:DNA-binding beta-propeller fold protein YncE
MCLFDLKGLPPRLPGVNGIAVVSVAFSPDSKRIVTAGGDKTARVWDPTTGALQLELKEKDQVGEYVKCAAFSPDGTQIATAYQAGSGGLVKVWDARTGKTLLEWQAHKFGVQRVAVSPDGARIVTGGQDQAVKVWDAQTAALLLDAKGMMSTDSSVAFSPDGKRIVAGRDDGTARVIDARTGAAERRHSPQAADPEIILSLPVPGPISGNPLHVVSLRLLVRGNFRNRVRRLLGKNRSGMCNCFHGLRVRFVDWPARLDGDIVRGSRRRGDDFGIGICHKARRHQCHEQRQDGRKPGRRTHDAPLSVIFQRRFGTRPSTK